MLSKTLDVAAVTDERATTAASSWDGLMAETGRASASVEDRIGERADGEAGATVDVTSGQVGGGAKWSSVVHRAARRGSTQAGTRQEKGMQDLVQTRLPRPG